MPAFSDVDFKSRFYCALLQARCVVVEGGPTFLNPVDEQQLVQWIKVRVPVCVTRCAHCVWQYALC